LGHDSLCRFDLERARVRLASDRPRNPVPVDATVGRVPDKLGWQAQTEKGLSRSTRPKFITRDTFNTDVALL
jgi:hypothetical protein